MKGLGGGTTKAFVFEAWNGQTSESLLSAFWTAATAGAYSMWGSSEIYNMGDPLPGMQNSVVPQYLRVLQDCMTELPYWEIEPANDAVSPGELEVDGQPWRTNFCAAKPGEVYLVYSEYGGAGRITLAGGGSYRVTRLNPRVGLRDDLGRVEAGPSDFMLPRGEWVLVYRREAASPSRSHGALTARPARQPPTRLAAGSAARRLRKAWAPARSQPSIRRSAMAVISSRCGFDRGTSSVATISSSPLPPAPRHGRVRTLSATS